MDILSSIPSGWRTSFVDTGRALAPIDHNPNRYDRTVTRWAANEPSLRGLRAAEVFAAPCGGLSEAQARAMIRTARTTDRDAELAGWSLVWQFGLAIIGMANRQQHLPGSEGPRAAVCTATAEIWRLIRHIDLDANKASIFYAITTKTRRVVLPCTHQLTTVACDTTLIGHPDRIPSTGPDLPTPEGHDAYEAVDWGLLAGQLVDPIVTDVIDRCGWNRESRHFDRRLRCLRNLVAWRVAEASVGERYSVPAIAAGLGESQDTIKSIHADLQRTMHCRVHRDHYHALLTGHELDAPLVGAGSTRRRSRS